MRIAIFLTDRCIGSGIHTILDALIATNYTLLKSGQLALFEWDTVSIDGKPVKPTNGLMIQPEYNLADYLESNVGPDVWIMPSVFQSTTNYALLENTINDAAPIIPVIRDHYDKGGIVVGICSGAFLLAKAGLLNNRPALMHWMSEQQYRHMFPKLKIDTHNTIADYGNIINVIGGGSACNQMIMHLVERFAGHQVAVNTAKVLLMRLNAPSPHSYRTNVETTEHGDELVLRAQRFMEKHSDTDVNLAALSEDLGISERQLSRRFVRRLDCSPTQYLQTIRINRACSLLELTQLPSSKIVFEVGYQDESSFRRLFKRKVNMTMETYRKHYGSIKVPAV